MKTRIITSIIALILFLPFLIIAKDTDANSLIAICQMITVVSSIELLKMTDFLKKLYVSIPCIAVAAAVPMMTKIRDGEFFSWCGITFFILAFYLLSVATFARKHTVQEYAMLFMLLFYVVTSASCIVMLYRQPYGEYIFILAFLCPWVTDSAAYFTGSALGKHKLIPEISPKKTVEGAVGGVIFCVVFVEIYLFSVGALIGLEVRALYGALAALVLSAVSMFGDLIMSLVKRFYKIKDYGDVFPGHGGMLDRFDSVLATAPFLFILYIIFEDFKLFV
ncbi:MAG: hypothetical protein E7675_06185 [Ruminococcaceae bacterium]|nr:hypothetical protein [Oscillospiraceae bacterium]